MSGAVEQGSSVEAVTESTPASTEVTQTPDSSVQQPAPVAEEPKNVTEPEPTGLDRLRKLADGELPMKKGKKKGEVAPPATETAKKDEKTAPKEPENGKKEGEITPAEGAEKTPETPAFKPNFKFKVMDQEHEIPELLRSVMKDPESEKLVRELHEKAYGLDIVKPRFIEERKQRQAIEGQYQQVIGGINNIKTLFQRGDIDGWLKAMAVPQEKILQWVIDKVNYNELPPEQRQVLDQRKAAEQRAWEAEQHTTTTQQQYEQEIVRAKDALLTLTLDRAEIKAAATAFDSAPGRKPGDFREAVIERGETAWLRSQGKIDLSPEQAALEVIRLYGIPTTAAAPAATPAAPAAPAAAVTQPPAQPKTPPVIPNVAGTSTSPMKTKPRSIADLKKLHAEMST